MTASMNYARDSVLSGQIALLLGAGYRIETNKLYRLQLPPISPLLESTGGRQRLTVPAPWTP
jgi:hypothetical protein